MPAHGGLILRYGVESVVTPAVLVAVDLVAEQNLLHEGEVFAATIAVLLGFLLVECWARVLTLVRY